MLLKNKKWNICNVCLISLCGNESEMKWWWWKLSDNTGGGAGMLPPIRFCVLELGFQLDFLVWGAVRKFPELWYSTVMVGHTATLTYSPSKYDPCAHTHTHLLHRSCRCWKHRRKASFGIFRSSAVTFNLMSSMVAKRNSSPRKAFLSSPNHRTLWISLQVSFGCSVLWKWASRGRVLQPWRTSKWMRWPNSRRFQKKPSAGASNNGRIDGGSVCEARVLLWRWLGKRCHMSYH